MFLQLGDNLWAQSNGNVGDVTFQNGNTTTTTGTSYRTTPTTLGMFGSGKYYWEIKESKMMVMIYTQVL